MSVTELQPPVGALGTDILSLAVEAASEIAPFGLSGDADFEIRWTLGPSTSFAYVPLALDGDVVTSVMVRLALN